MPYSVQFVGLACFLRSNGGRTVLLPDGRSPDAGIDPHFASIAVDKDAVIASSGWPAGHGDDGVFELDPCTIVLEGADRGGTLDTSQQDDNLPQLKRINPAFSIDLAKAQTIARLELRQGTLKAYRVPGGTAVMSQLDVPHDGEIRITVTPEDGSQPRTIDLQPGTEVAIINAARHAYETVVEENGHFRIYEKLAAEPARARLTQPADLPKVPPSPTRHSFFARRTPIGLSTSCSNTGCCAP
jgi:hypothetical protein